MSVICWCIVTFINSNNRILIQYYLILRLTLTWEREKFG